MRSRMRPTSSRILRRLVPLARARSLERWIVLQIDLVIAALGAVKRWLGDIEISAINDFGHLTEKEGQQQRSNMAAVDIGVGHDDDLVIARFFDIEIVAPDAGAKSGNQRANFRR